MTKHTVVFWSKDDNGPDLLIQMEIEGTRAHRDALVTRTQNDLAQRGYTTVPCLGDREELLRILIEGWAQAPRGRRGVVEPA